jgi:hypothetical protein
MISPQRVTDIVFEEFAAIGVPVDFSMLCYAMDMTERVGVPKNEVAWRRIVRSELRVFSPREIRAVWKQLAEEEGREMSE